VCVTADTVISHEEPLAFCGRVGVLLIVVLHGSGFLSPGWVKLTGRSKPDFVSRRRRNAIPALFPFAGCEQAKSAAYNQGWKSVRSHLVAVSWLTGGSGTRGTP
jgi:hypothetical protein